MTPAAYCRPLTQRCSPTWHNESRVIAMRVNAATGFYWDEQLSGLTWASCIGCRHGMAWMEVGR